MARGRKPLTVPSRELHVSLSSELLKQIDERLWSEAEQRVPKGAYQAFITEAVVRMMNQKSLDLAPYANSIPSEHVVHAYDGSMQVLLALLERRKKNGTVA